MESSNNRQTKTKGQKAREQETESPRASITPGSHEMDYESMANEIAEIAAPVSFEELKKFYNL